MVYNPYAKKRPRPSDWDTSTSTESSTSNTTHVYHHPISTTANVVPIEEPSQQQRPPPTSSSQTSTFASTSSNSANIIMSATNNNGITTTSISTTTNINPALLNSVVPPLTTVRKPSPNPYLKKRITSSTTTSQYPSSTMMMASCSARRTVVFPQAAMVPLPLAGTTITPNDVTSTIAQKKSLTYSIPTNIEQQGGLGLFRENNNNDFDRISLPRKPDTVTAQPLLRRSPTTINGHSHCLASGVATTSKSLHSIMVGQLPRSQSWNSPTLMSMHQHSGGMRTSTTENFACVDDRSSTSSLGPFSGTTSHVNLSQQQLQSIDSSLLLPEQYTDLPSELAYTPDQVQPIQDVYRLQLIKNATLQQPLKNGWVLFPHQKKAIIRSLTMRRMILALDMGLGKTIIGAIWAKAFQKTYPKLKVFVICPVSLQVEWKRTAEDKAGLPVQQEGNTTTTGRKGNKKKAGPKKLLPFKGKKPMGVDVAKIGDSDDDEEEEKTEDGYIPNAYRVKICSWSKFPTAVESYVEHFVVVCDEAHSMQSIQAARTKDVLTLTKDRRCVGLLLLTGTPMKNGKPSNLFPLLKAVRHPLGRNQKAYETHFCNGGLKNFGKGSVWDATGCSNLAQLQQLVASNLLHMTKEQCLSDLPPLANISHHVPVSSRFQIQYERCVKDLACVQANSKNLNDEAILGVVQRLRVICAFAKVEATVELARTILNSEPAIVIFSNFAQVAKEVYSKLVASGWPCELLTGETPQKKRQQMVDNFQNGLSSVFVCTFGAGGVGLTLTAAATIILVDRPWTPGEARQAEDRIRRIGQEKDCKSYWMCSFDLDKQIDEMLVSKKQTTDAVLNRNKSGGDNNNASGMAPTVAKMSINKLVSSFLLSASRKQL